MEASDGYYESYFKDGYNSKLLQLSDGKLRTEDGCTFCIHKFTLAKSSKYFYALFCGMGSGKEDILIPGIKGNILSNILSYLYTDKFHVTEENICDLIIASDYLLLDDFLYQLKAILRMTLTVSNCLSIFIHTLNINREEFSKESCRFVQTHFESIVHSRDCNISDLPEEVFKELLVDRNLSVKSERTVWLAITKWVGTDASSRLCQVPDLLMYLTISDVDETIADEILKHEIVSKNPYCQEILEVKSLMSGDSLRVLQYHSQTHSNQVMTCFNHRQPAKMHFVVYYHTHNGADGIQVFLTYDEGIDLWRKIFEISLSPRFVISVDERLYLFRSSGRNCCYNVIEKQWYEIRDFRSPRYNYEVVGLDGSIYVLGGISEHTGHEIYDVEFYNIIFDEWYYTTPMIPVSSFIAVTYRGLIYVLGYRQVFLDYEMVAQVYDPSEETWTLLPFPSTVLRFSLVVYHEKMYVIGGSNGVEPVKNVEVFDPGMNEWSAGVDLPYIYYVPQAVVLNDNLIVFDGHGEDRTYLETNPPVKWNRCTKSWESFEESSPMSTLHRHYFITVENSNFINILSDENRDPATHFESSCFRDTKF